jgi:dTDP-glucose pyrophosphorylase
MIQVLMPAAGGARPFTEAGHRFPKPLIEVLGQPLVAYAVASARPAEPHRFVFVVSAADAGRYHLDATLQLLAPDCAVRLTEKPTAGALCTALLAIDELDPDKPLLLANADQWLRHGCAAALADFRDRDLDVGIVTFNALHPRWSFVAVGRDGLVIETAEKRPISNLATVGLYYYRTASLFLRSAEQALRKNVTVNGQFFIVPAINQLILEGARVGHHAMANDDFFPLGVPSDVQRFTEVFKTSPIA